MLPVIILTRPDPIRVICMKRCKKSRTTAVHSLMQSEILPVAPLHVLISLLRAPWVLRKGKRPAAAQRRVQAEQHKEGISGHVSCKDCFA